MTISVEAQCANRHTFSQSLWNTLKLNQYLSCTSELSLLCSLSLSVSEFHPNYPRLVQPELATCQLHTHMLAQQPRHKALPI